MTSGAGHPSSVQDVSSAPPTVKAPIADGVVVVVTPAPPPPPNVLAQEAAPPIPTEVSAPTALAGSTVVPSSTVAAPLQSVGVVSTSGPMTPPSSSSAPIIPPSTALASTSTSSHPRASLDHIYTSNDVDSLRGIG